MGDGLDAYSTVWEPARFSGQHMIGYMLFICFGYYYKALIHLFHVPGYPDRDPPLYQGTDFNHWLELALYCPLMWVCMHMMVDNVFSLPLPGHNDTASTTRRKRWRFLTDFCVAYFFFAQGAHQIANNLEMYSRRILGLEGTPIHKVIYFFDEDLTHVMQFIPMYAIFFLVTLHDPPGRFISPLASVVAGAGHGVENAIGIIEGNQPWIVGPAVLSMVVAASFRWKYRYNDDTRAVWRDFFFRYMTMKATMMSLSVVAWHFLFGLYVQSHELPMWQVAVFGVGATSFGIAMMLCWDHFRDRLLFRSQAEPISADDSEPRELIEQPLKLNE